MAQASSRANTSVFNRDTERLVPDSFLDRDERNWLVDGQTAQCNDGNFGNVAIFSRRKFRRNGNTSFLLTISCSESSEYCIIGLGDNEFMQQSNKDMRSEREYGDLNPQGSWLLWPAAPDPPRPGNSLLGRARNEFNIGVSLNRETYVQGNRTQDAIRCALKGKKVRVRVNVKDNELRVIAPALWGERDVVEHIRSSNPLRLAINARQGFSFKLEEIQERFTLAKEAVDGFDINLTDKRLENWSKKRYKKIVKKIRDATNISNINIVVVGAFGSGKSSLVNTLLTAFSGSTKNRPKTNAFVMNDPSGQGTRVIESYTLLKSQLKLIDAIGMDAIDSQNAGDTNWGNVLEPLLRGNIQEGFQNEYLEVNTKSLAQLALDDEKHGDTETKQADEGELAGMIATESLDVHSMNHGVLLVGNPNMHEDFSLIHNKIARLCGGMGMPIFGVITQLDRNIRDFSIRKLYTDPFVGEMYENARNTMTVHCFPVRCYTREDQRQNIMYNWLAVEALDALFGQAVEYKRQLAYKYGADITLPELDLESSCESSDRE